MGPVVVDQRGRHQVEALLGEAAAERVAGHGEVELSEPRQGGQPVLERGHERRRRGRRVDVGGVEATIALVEQPQRRATALPGHRDVGDLMALQASDAKRRGDGEAREASLVFAARQPLLAHGGDDAAGDEDRCPRVVSVPDAEDARRHNAQGRPPASPRQPMMPPARIAPSSDSLSVSRSRSSAAMVMSGAVGGV